MFDNRIVNEFNPQETLTVDYQNNPNVKKNKFQKWFEPSVEVFVVSRKAVAGLPPFLLGTTALHCQSIGNDRGACFSAKAVVLKLC